MTKRKKESEKKKVGRPTRYTKEIGKKVFTLCKKGFTMIELAEFFEVNEQTIYNWKDKHPEFFEAIKNGTQEYDSEMEVALNKKGMGGYHLTDITVEYDGEGNVTKKTLKKREQAPDTGAAFIWLKNRQRDKWKDKHEDKPSGNSGAKAIADFVKEMQVVDDDK